MLPSDKHILEFKKQCIIKVDAYINNLKYMLYPYIVDNLKITKRADFTVDVYEYVQFDWLILLCCSLKYCEPMEREVRLDKVFEILDKIREDDETKIVASNIKEFTAVKSKSLNIDITNLEENKKDNLRGALKFFSGEKNNIQVYIVNNERKDAAGGIFLNDKILKEFEELIGKQRVKIE